MDRHDGEELVDTPAVGQALEQREVAEVLVGKQLRQLAEVVGHVLHVLGDGQNLTCHAPEHALDLCACLKVNDTVAEELECLLAYLLCIVQCLEHIALVKVAPNLVELLCKVVVVGCNLPILVHLWKGCCLEHLKDEYRVVCRYRASALCDDVGVGDTVLVGCINHGVDGVVHVLLDRVVHTALAA